MTYIPAKVAVANAKANAERIQASAQTTGVPHPIALVEVSEPEQVAYENELWECFNCGVLTRDEVKQVERHECCMEACVYCNRDADPIR